VYKRVTIRVNGNGVTVRDQEIGRNIGTKRQFLATEGQFLLSKIDARNGAMGIAPADVDGAIITADFLAFDIDESVIDAYFFWLLSTTKQFITFCKSCSSGTTNRQRLDEQLFLDVKIPLPSLDVQKILVRQYQANLGRAIVNEQTSEEIKSDIRNYLMNELKINIRRTEVKYGMQLLDFKDLTRWSLRAAIKARDLSKRAGKYSTKRLGEICESRSGGTPYKANSNFWNGNIPWVSPKDMKVDFIEKAEDYITEQAISSSSAPLIEPGQILFVVRSGILRHTVPVAVNTVAVSINQDMRAFRIVDKIVSPEYLFFYFKYFQHDLLESVKTSTTVESIDSHKLDMIEIPVPPKLIQSEIVSVIDSMKNRAQTLRTEAAALRQTALSDFEKAIFTIS
jgi:type I restriction enzyme, S subunit